MGKKEDLQNKIKKLKTEVDNMLVMNKYLKDVFLRAGELDIIMADLDEFLLTAYRQNGKRLDYVSDSSDGFVALSKEIIKKSKTQALDLTKKISTEITTKKNQIISIEKELEKLT